MACVEWVKASDGEVPRGAFPAGVTENGETAYIARPIRSYSQASTPCSLIPSTGAIVVSSQGKYSEARNYEVLTCSDPDILYWEEQCMIDTPVPKSAVYCKHNLIGRTCTSLDKGVPISGPYDIKHMLSKPGFEGPLIGGIVPFNYYHPGLHVMFKKQEYVFTEYSILCAYRLPPLTHTEEAAVSWVETSGLCLPPNTLRGCTASSGEGMYIGRAQVRPHQIVPGFVIPSAGKLRVCWSTGEYRYDVYEALVVDDPTAFEWVYAIEGKVPPNAVEGGRQNGETLYIGRTVLGSDLSIGQSSEPVPFSLPVRNARHVQLLGKVHPSRCVLCVPYGGQEYIYKDYEVLTRNKRLKKLMDLCRNEVLLATKGISGRIDCLPLPSHLKEFCKLRENELGKHREE